MTKAPSFLLLGTGKLPGILCPSIDMLGPPATCELIWRNLKISMHTILIQRSLISKMLFVNIRFRHGGQCAIADYNSFKRFYVKTHDRLYLLWASGLGIFGGWRWAHHIIGWTISITKSLSDRIQGFLSLLISGIVSVKIAAHWLAGLVIATGLLILIGRIIAGSTL